VPIGITVGEPVVHDDGLPAVVNVPPRQSYTVMLLSESPCDVFVTLPPAPTCTVRPQLVLTRDVLQALVIPMLSLRETDGQLAVFEVPEAEPPPTPFMVAVTTSDPPFAVVVIVAV